MNYLFTKTPLLFFMQSFWRDEAFTYLLSRKSLFDIINLTAKDFNPPLYYFIVHFWMKVFGTSEISLRSISLIFYWATVYVAFLFLNDIFKFRLKKSFLYLLLVIINPLLVYYAFEARMYTMFAFLGSLSFYALYKKDPLLYILATILGLYTHYFMVFVLLGQLLIILLVEGNKKIKLLQSILLSGILFLPWGIFVLLTKPGINQSFWIEKPPLIAIPNLLGILFIGHEAAKDVPKIEILKRIVVYVNIILILLYSKIAFFFRRYFNKPNFKILFYLLVWALLIPIIVGLISFIKPVYLSRYLIFSTVGILIMTLYLIDKLNIKLRIISLLLLVFLSGLYQQNQVIARKKTDLRKTIEEIKMLAHKDDKLYVTSELDLMVAQYYFPENRVFLYEKNYQDIPSYVGKILITPGNITYHLPRYPTKAFILNSYGSYEVKAIF